jgi:hypothetical protein
MTATNLPVDNSRLVSKPSAKLYSGRTPAASMAAPEGARMTDPPDGYRLFDFSGGITHKSLRFFDEHAGELGEFIEAPRLR